MKLKYRLLEHPFYQAWNKGEISMEQLTKYAHSYLEFITQIPLMWSRIDKGLSINSDKIHTIIKEEENHIALWETWYSDMPSIVDYPSMQPLIDSFNRMTASELLGALHSFEIQQPEIAIQKKNVLKSFYNIEDEKLHYFDEHLMEEEHINYGKFIYENYANKKEFIIGAFDGSMSLYKNLDLFLAKS
jgi:pyrroloquinoline-quinone synthase